MKPSWGLIAALALMTGSLFLLGAAIRPFIARAAAMAKSPVKHFTQEQLDEEVRWWKDEAAKHSP